MYNSCSPGQRCSSALRSESVRRLQFQRTELAEEVSNSIYLILCWRQEEPRQDGGWGPGVGDGGDDSINVTPARQLRVPSRKPSGDDILLAGATQLEIPVAKILCLLVMIIINSSF